MLQFEFVVAWMRSRTAGSERGASLVEYALLLSLIALACIAAVGTLGTNLNNDYTDNTNSMFNP